MRMLIFWGTDDNDDDGGVGIDADSGGGGGRIRPPSSRRRARRARRAADLLARDASYGDLRTPLVHKAVAAGADWATCLHLLERAAAAADVARDGAAPTAASSTRMRGVSLRSRQH